MIPLKLQLKNFVSYGPMQEIDFGTYNLICLSGKNGHGKSALLDALSWVVWGQARKVGGVAKADEGLLRLGQTHMMVSLDFSCNNTLYRVRREFTVTANKSQTTLEFGILDQTTNTIRPLTDKTIRATQAKIETTIGLDYHSFINSAFLRQGQANEFSKKTPKERKEILATILGLDHFEQMRKLALDKSKDALHQKEQIRSRVERLQQDIKEKPEILKKLHQLEDTLKFLLAKEAKLKIALEDIKLKNNHVAKQKAQAENIAFQKNHLTATLEQHTQQILEHARQWRHIARQQRTQKPYEQLNEERTHVQAELQQIHILASQKIQLKEEYLAKKETLRQFIQELQEQYKAAQEKIALQKQAITINRKTTEEKVQTHTKKIELIHTELARLQAEHKVLQAIPAPDEMYKTALEKRVDRRTAYYHRFSSQVKSISTHSASVEQKKQLIIHAEQARCPLCDQIADKEALCTKFEMQQKIINHQQSRLTTVLHNLKEVLAQDHDALELIKKNGEQHHVSLIKITELEKQKALLLNQRETLEQELTMGTASVLDLNRQQEQLDQTLLATKTTFEQAAEGEDYKKMKLNLTRVEQALEKVPHDPSREKALHEKLYTLSEQLTQQSSFLQEGARQEERKRSVHEKCRHARELKKQITFLTRTAEELNSYKQQESALILQEKEVMLLEEKIRKEKELLLEQKGALEAHCTAISKQEHECQAEKKALEAAGQQIKEYTTIATAFSKDGIQALLIEDALPEIEHEANHLLGSLTDNQAHLSIESLRDLRSGKTKETLDIKISDAMGVRPYELFSGGEAFRIDFSLRIAISKLLARRAGTALQTLIIDEGFGSQDEDGLSNIMEALYRIQDDFAKIIIVSHLPSLKEQFPVHFQVTKTAEGSIIKVIEHC